MYELEKAIHIILKNVNSITSTINVDTIDIQNVCSMSIVKG
nr:hypothetical protein [Clostridioides sp.]